MKNEKMKMKKIRLGVFAVIAITFLFSCGNEWVTEIIGPKSITFNSNGGNPVEGQTVYSGQRITMPSDPSKTDHTFCGWYADNDTFNRLWNFDDIPDTDMTLHAKWTPVYVPAPVPGPVPVSAVTLKTTASIYLYADDPTETLIAVISPINAANKNVTWESSDPHVAEVSAEGKVTAVSVGTAIITVTTEDGGKTANCSVRITDVIMFDSLSADGNAATMTTTELTLDFNAPVKGLSADDIIISGVPGVTKGALSNTGSTYTLPISGFTTDEPKPLNISVSVSKAGYAIGGSPLTAQIFYMIPVTFESLSADGNAVNADTTELTLEFSREIEGLTADDITISGVSGVTKGALSNTGSTYTLPVSGFTSGGTLTVSVANPHGYIISDSPKTVPIFYMTRVTLNGVTQANGSSTSTTTSLALTFSASVTGLTASDITISDGSLTVTKESLSGSGASYTLGVTVNGSAGTSENRTVTVSDPPGYFISGSPKTVTVWYAVPVDFVSVTQNGNAANADTTQLTLNFSAEIAGLTAADITISGVSGVTKGALSNTGSTYTLPVSGFTSGGTLSVSVSKAGYAVSGSPKTVQIFYMTRVTLNSVTQANGNSTSTTTSLALTFSANITGLAASDISISGGSLTVTKGSLSGSGTSYTLGVTVSGSTGGSETISVTVANPSGYVISGSPKTVTVWYAVPVTFSALSANGNSSTKTTQLTLTFSQAITGLAAADITVSGAGAVKGSLSGTGPAYTLSLTNVTSSGTVTVSVSKAGYAISPASRTASVYVGITNVTFVSATANGSSSSRTTTITLTFSEAIPGLSVSNVSLANTDGYQGITWSITALSGSGPTYTATVTFNGARNGLQIYEEVSVTSPSGYVISPTKIQVNIWN